MARTYDAVDMFWSNDGDLAISNKGDWQDTSYDPLRSLHQQVDDRIKADNGDYALQQHIGASLSRFVGMKNSRETGVEIRAAVRNALLRDSLIDPRDLSVQVAPISPEIIAIKININYAPTRANQDSLSVTKVFLYDYRDNNVYPASNKFSKE